jgi:hypothetical protein
VGLARLSASFTMAGEGALALIDPVSLAVTPVALEGFTNCGEVAPHFSAADRVLVVCAGTTFGDEEDRRGHAGLLLLSIDEEGLATIDSYWAARDHPAEPVPSSGALSLGDERILAVAMGDEHRPDRLVLYDLDAGTAETVLEAEAPFSLGRGALGVEGDFVLVPDALMGVHRFRVVGERLVPLEALRVSSCRRLGAREIGSLR